MRPVTLAGVLALVAATGAARPAPASHLRMEAENHAGQHGTRIVTVDGASGGRVVDRISGGDWLRYRDVAISDVRGTLLCFTTAAPVGTDVATLDIRLGSRRAAPVRSIVVHNNVGAGARQSAFGGPLPDGVHTVYLTVRQPDRGPTFALDYISFYDAPPPPTLNC